jgi:hypothetical protein
MHSIYDLISVRWMDMIILGCAWILDVRKLFNLQSDASYYCVCSICGLDMSVIWIPVSCTKFRKPVSERCMRIVLKGEISPECSRFKTSPKGNGCIDAGFGILWHWRQALGMPTASNS